MILGGKRGFVSWMLSFLLKQIFQLECIPLIQEFRRLGVAEGGGSVPVAHVLKSNTVFCRPPTYPFFCYYPSFRKRGLGGALFRRKIGDGRLGRKIGRLGGGARAFH